VTVEQIGGGYKPAEDEAFMNERQKDYFRRKLIAWKEEILRESQETLVVLQSENENHPDLADRASFETDRSIEIAGARQATQAYLKRSTRRSLGSTKAPMATVKKPANQSV